MPEVGNLKAKVTMSTVEFNQGIQTLSKQMSIVREEFKQASSGLDKVKDAMQIAQLRAKSLGDQIGIQSKIVDTMREAHRKAVEQFGEGSKQAVNYELKLKQSESTLKRLEGQLSNTNAEIKKHSSAFATAGEKFKQLGITWESVGNKMASVGKTLSIAVTAPLVLLGKSMLTMAMDAVESENLFDVSMGNMAESGREFSEQLRNELGLNAYEVRKNVATINDMTHSMGLTKTQSYDLATGLTKLSYDLASFKNLKPEEAFQKLQAGITGEAEPLKRLGILVNDNTIKTYAYKNGIAAMGEELTEQQKVLARYGAIMEQTTNAQGDMARTIDSPTNQLRIFQEQIKQISIDMGTLLIPTFTKVVGKLSDLAKWFDGLSTEQKENIAKWGAIAAVIGPVLFVIGKLIIAIPGLVAGVKALNVGLALLAANPVVLSITALVAVVGLLALSFAGASAAAAKAAAEITEEYRKVAEEEKKAIDEAHAARLNSLNDQLNAAETASTERMQVIQKEYDTEIELVKKKEQALRKDLQERQSALSSAHKTEIQRIRDEYGVYEEKSKSKTDIARAQYDREVELATRAFDAKMAMLDKEYNERLKTLDAETLEKVLALQGQINAIDETTKEENRIAREKADADRVLSLEARIANEEDAERRKELQIELQTFLAEKAREKVLEARELEKDVLRERIAEERQAAEDKKTALAAELEAQKIALKDSLEDEKVLLLDKKDKAIEFIQLERLAKEGAEIAKYNAAKHTLDQEELALEGYAARLTVRLGAELMQKQRLEQDKLTATQKRINDEIEAERKKVEDLKALVDLATDVKIQIAIAAQAKKALPSYADGQPVAANAMGTNNWRGGLTQVHEKGGEILNLPSGTQIIPHDVSVKAVGALGKSMVVHLTVANHGTVVGRNGMAELAQAVGQEIGERFGASVGGKW